jgi:hypothetical protein
MRIGLEQAILKIHGDAARCWHSIGPLLRPLDPVHEKQGGTSSTRKRLALPLRFSMELAIREVTASVVVASTSGLL